MESFSLEDLAQEHERTRRLVASLVGNPDLGEDAVQDAWIKLLERSREFGSNASPRRRAAWLSVAARRFAWNERRRTRRQHARERSNAREEALPSSADIAARAEISRRVVEALEGLHEPHASVLRDHYFGGLSVAEIARHDDLPIETVRSRIRRARARLRTRLETSGLGGDVHWSVSAAPFVLGTTSVAPAPTATEIAIPAAFIMKKLIVSASAVALVLVLTLVHSRSPEWILPAPEGNDVDRMESLGRLDGEDSSEAEQPGVAGPALDRRGVAAASESSPLYRLSGTVVDGDRRPIEGATVRVSGFKDWPGATHRVRMSSRNDAVDGFETTSDSNGSFGFGFPVPIPERTQLLVTAGRHRSPPASRSLSLASRSRGRMTAHAT